MRWIGDGAAPLWLRLEPIPHHGDPKHIRNLRYTMLLVTLDRNLVWVPSGSEDVRTVKDVRDHHGYMFRQHRSRSETLRRMTGDGTEGYISEVAMSLIEEHGLATSDVFRQAKRPALEDRRGGVPLARGEAVETLYFDDGVLVASFPFEGGHFHKDTLSIWGDYPEALANAAKGRRIADFVDHPALIDSGLTADRGETRQGALDIFTAGRPLTLEEAERRQRRYATAAHVA